MITEEEWSSILRAFPAAQQVTVRDEIEAARGLYLRDQRQPGEQRKLWQRITKLLKSAAVTKLCQLVSRVDLNELPDPSFVDPLADCNWLPRMTGYLSRGAKITAAYADLSNSSGSQIERFGNRTSGKIRAGCDGRLIPETDHRRDNQESCITRTLASSNECNGGDHTTN